MRFEEFKAKSKIKPEQVELSFEKKSIRWDGYIGNGQRDRAGEEQECHWVYADGKFTRDGEAVSFDDLISAIGPNIKFYGKDLRFQKMLEAEKKKNPKM